MFRAKKSLGQNFIINKGVIEKIVNAAELNSNDLVVEIGPGTGNLTSGLIEKAGRIIAVEKDTRLALELKIRFGKRAGVEIIEEDILKFNPQRYKIRDTKYKILGNIPYYITSHLLKIIFDEWPKPELVVLTVQKEVAQRIVAQPPKMNLLALSVQFYAEPKIISYVSRGSFRPIPKVDSAILRLRPKDNLQLTTDNQQHFFKLIKKAFAGKRKQLKNTIGPEILKNTGIKLESRPEELSLEDWIKISSNYIMGL